MRHCSLRHFNGVDRMTWRWLLRHLNLEDSDDVAPLFFFFFGNYISCMVIILLYDHVSDVVKEMVIILISFLIVFLMQLKRLSFNSL